MTPKDKILNTLQEIFSNTFDDPNLSVNSNTTSSDVMGWDSLANIRLIVSIEKYFNIRFTALEISELQNVGELVNLISLKLGKK